MNLAAVLARADPSALLAPSDERAGWLACVLAAEAEGYWRGYRLAEARHACDYDAGHRDGVFARKHAGIALRDLVMIEGKRCARGA